MCRLALFNYAGAEYIEAYYGLERFFQYLEDMNGGDGNGIAVLRDGRFTIKKGVYFTPKEAAEELLRKEFTWAIFHTRLASAGSVRDSNCHPFRRGRYILAMNGTEHGFSAIADAMGGITDTEAILITLHRLRLPVEALLGMSSVFIGFDGYTPFVVRGSWGSLQLQHNKDWGAVIFASEFPVTEGFEEVYDLPRPFLWKGIGRFVLPEGAKKVKNIKVTRFARAYGGWAYDDDYCDYTWLNNINTKKQEG